MTAIREQLFSMWHGNTASVIIADMCVLNMLGSVNTSTVETDVLWRLNVEDSTSGEVIVHLVQLINNL